MKASFRLVSRLAGLVVVVSTGIFEYLMMAVSRQGCRPAKRALWLQRLSRRSLKVLNVRTRYQGAPPRLGLLVCNHLSYLDILVLIAERPMVFVAKSEVSKWPIFGPIARGAGTLFINRSRKGDVARVALRITRLIEEGIVVAVFPEGTSSDGHTVLPFRPSLFEPVASHRWPVSAASIAYQLSEGSVEDEVCYWRDMNFVSHFLNLLSKKEIAASVAFSPPLPPGHDRKAMARMAHTQVCALRGEC